MRKASFIFGILFALIIQSAVASDIILPGWVSDHMMLPTETSFNLEGRAESHKTVSVSFGSVSVTAACDDSGSWTIEFPAVKAGMKGELVFESNSDVKVIRDVATGDTWLCSGQSNMQRRVANSDAAEDAEKDIQALDISSFDGKSWKKVTSENVKSFSAVAIYFAIEMARRQHLPVGIYVAARGGTSIDAWIPGNAFPETESGSLMRSLINDPEVLKAAEEDRADFRPVGEYRLARWGLSRAVPASHYEQLIRPFNDLPVRGVVWYQGESNAGSVEQAREYDLWLSNLVSEYRELWGNPALQFVIIQLPSFDPGTPAGRKAWKVLQKRQARVARQTDNAEVVGIKDLGDLNDIHPQRKKEVGVRTSDVAWKITHSDKN
jgi:sialate O-acetylesterase